MTVDAYWVHRRRIELIRPLVLGGGSHGGSVLFLSSPAGSIAQKNEGRHEIHTRLSATQSQCQNHGFPAADDYMAIMLSGA